MGPLTPAGVGATAEIPIEREAVEAARGAGGCSDGNLMFT